MAEQDKGEKGFYHAQRVVPFFIHALWVGWGRNNIPKDQILEPVKYFAVAYINDILIFSKTWEEHLIHIRKVLGELRKANLTVNPKKCKIVRTKVEYLGFVVGKGCILPQEGKVEKMSKWPSPRTKKEIQQFLGLPGYYRQFIPNFAAVGALPRGRQGS